MQSSSSLYAAPSAPADIIVRSAHSENVVITVVGPLLWNSEPLGFEVQWAEKEGSSGPERRDLVLPPDWFWQKNELNVTLPLQPGREYNVSVRARGKGDAAQGGVLNGAVLSTMVATTPRGDAAAALAGLPPTAWCYSDTVELHKKRFGNEQLLSQEHMKKLIDVQPVRSSDDVRGLRRLYDTLAAHIKGLETLGQKHDSYSSLLMPIVQRALPTDILLDYIRQCFIATTSSSDEGEESTTDDAS
ncbi:hypothetical protein V5799_024027 [Amblyomma americanum]|uniref:Fibronectin type-III domain-containing protein n=1 Tax=Amblyomma americanum TaxID=6943 RepID=A0AAQ4EDK0_AMBAM